MSHDAPTRVTLFVPGTPPSLAAWDAALRPRGLRLRDDVLSGEGLATGVAVEWIEGEGAFARSFPFETVPEPGLRALDRAPGALVLSWTRDLREGRAEIVGAVSRLRDAGALAVRLEQSKLGWGVDRWLELFSDDAPRAWHYGAVVYLGAGDALQSCGMHAFSLPDVRVPQDDDPEAIQQLASILNIYQLGEDPLLLTGHTFSPEPDAPRRVLERWPDGEYPAGHPCHNPYGCWRLGPPGGTGRPPRDPVPVFMPALAVLLSALESKHGRALTQVEVEEMRDGGVCMTMAARHAQSLERSRGYADLDPELAWEQWQLVRSRDA